MAGRRKGSGAHLFDTATEQAVKGSGRRRRVDVTGGVNKDVEVQLRIFITLVDIILLLCGDE